jgi:hypothetical protein
MADLFPHDVREMHDDHDNRDQQKDPTQYVGITGNMAQALHT